MARTPRNAPPKITLFGLFGSGNLGNDATLAAVIEGILSRIPETNLQCVCADPGEVTRRFAIPAVSFSRAAVPHWLGRWGRLFREWWTYATALRTLWLTNVLIFCGTNLFSDYLTGPTGWPYDIFKWTLLGRLCGVEVVVLGAGVGPVVNPMSRWLFKHTLSRAVFCSYRDETSLRWAQTLGVDHGRNTLSPDIVFGISMPTPSVRPSDRTATIGVGLKDYPEIEEAGRPRYRAYVDIMAEFVATLLKDGVRVRLLIGDFIHDPPVVQDVIEAVRKLHPITDALLTDVPRSVDELMEFIRPADVVISPRFHNLVLGLLLGKPVASLADHHKLDEVARQFGLQRYCLRLDSLKPEELIETTRELLRAAPDLKDDIALKVAEYRQILSGQYDEMLSACGLNAASAAVQDGTHWEHTKGSRAQLCDGQSPRASVGGISR